MASGYPDYLSWPGTSAAGEEVVVILINEIVASEADETHTIVTVPTGYEYILQALQLYTRIDTGFSQIYIYAAFPALFLYYGKFVEKLEANLPGAIIVAGSDVKIYFENNSPGLIKYEGALSFVKRPV